jgi:hypothetical protein
MSLNNQLCPERHGTGRRTGNAICASILAYQMPHTNKKYCGAAIELLHCKEKIGVVTYGVRVIY